MSITILEALEFSLWEHKTQREKGRPRRVRLVRVLPASNGRPVRARFKYGDERMNHTTTWTNFLQNFRRVVRP